MLFKSSSHPPDPHRSPTVLERRTLTKPSVALRDSSHVNPNNIAILKVEDFLTEPATA